MGPRRGRGRLVGTAPLESKTADVDDDPAALADGARRPDSRAAGDRRSPVLPSFGDVSNNAYAIVDRPLAWGSAAQSAADAVAKGMAEHVASTFAEAEGMALNAPGVDRRRQGHARQRARRRSPATGTSRRRGTRFDEAERLPGAGSRSAGATTARCTDSSPGRARTAGRGADRRPRAGHRHRQLRRRQDGPGQGGAAVAGARFRDRLGAGGDAGAGRQLRPRSCCPRSTMKSSSGSSSATRAAPTCWVGSGTATPNSNSAGIPSSRACSAGWSSSAAR